MRREVALAFVLLLLPVFGLILSAPAVHATISIAYQRTDHQNSGCSTAYNLVPVTQGDLMAVGVLIYDNTETVSSVSDTVFGSSFPQAVELSDVQTVNTAAIYYATMPAGGNDQVTVSLSACTAQYDVYIFVVSGVTPTTVTTGTGLSPGRIVSSSVATSPTPFTFPAFLIAVVGFADCGFGGTLFETLSTGSSGFTYVTAPTTSPAGHSCSGVETSDPASSSTTFPGTIQEGGVTHSDNWVEVGAAFSAPAASTTTTTGPPIPEYPLGLPVLAILTIIAYAVIKRRTSES